MPRDLFLIVGDEIIETSPAVRARYFEADLYKELFTGYFNRGARWTLAPRSRLLGRNFDFSYVLRHGFCGNVPADPFHELMFGGAQIRRFGQRAARGSAGAGRGGKCQPQLLPCRAWKTSRNWPAWPPGSRPGST